ncbi:MAG: MFS transporter [Bacteroidales bacterium]|nr:MFS transporter [Bacteroidales bacterium]MBN2632798.1 MFS transporter [Bacteroidales bacterium]
MSENKINLRRIAPVLMAFFVMSFVDIVGIGVDRVSTDMGLSSTLAQLIPSAAFLWFFLLSVPVGVLQSRLGKRFMLNIGMGITAIGLLVPYIFYTFEMVLVGFALLGMGNTIVQVSANPLLVDVVPGNRTSSFLSFSQFVKAIGSMLGAPLAIFFASRFGDWKLLFLVFGIVSLLSVIWLGSIKIEESGDTQTRASLGSAFKLLGNGFVLMMVLSIFLVVGVDVGFNSNSGQFLIRQFGIEQNAAESGRSIYFFGRMLGTFGGAILLTRISARKFFMWTSFLGIICFTLLIIAKSVPLAWFLVFMTGLTVANIWPLVFSIAVQKYPQRSNEISGLMMMAISGGAVIPFLAGWVSDMSNMAIGMTILLACMVYLWLVSLYCLKRSDR